MFENDDWYSLKYDFNELDGENLECCILDTTIKLGQQKFNKNTLKLNIPKKGSITIASQVFVAYQLIDPNGKIIGSGNVDYDDFQFTVEQEKSSDYDITLYKKAIVVSDGELSRAFLDNEISADEKYKGKLIEVTGRIDDLGKSKYGDIQYILHGSSGGGGIQCVLAEINNKEKLRKRNQYLIAELDSILINDQKYRSIITKMERSPNNDSSKLVDLYTEMRISDSLNLLRIEAILDTYCKYPKYQTVLF
jgi:hypothetical protein